MAKRERMLPTKLSWRSVIEAIPTPTSKRKRENLILWLQQAKHKVFWSLSNMKISDFNVRGKIEGSTYLNCFLRKRVSSNTVNGMIASLVIYKKEHSKWLNQNKKNLFHVSDLWKSVEKKNLIESNRIESKAQVEEANGNAI